MFESKLNRGINGGYTPLDTNNKVPLKHLPPFDSGDIVDGTYDFNTGTVTLTNKSGGTVTITGITSENIYNSDGFLTDNRTLSLSGKTLNFSGSSGDFRFNNKGQLRINWPSTLPEPSTGNGEWQVLINNDNPMGPPGSLRSRPLLIRASSGDTVWSWESNSNLTSPANQIIFSVSGTSTRKTGYLLRIAGDTNSLSAENDLPLWEIQVNGSKNVNTPVTNRPLLSFNNGTNPTLTTPVFKIFQTGNFLINQNNDAGFKLDVGGSGRFTNTLQLDTVNSASTDTKILTLSSGNVVQYINLSTITGATSADTYTTGFTYNSANTFTILDNSGNTFNATFNEVTGLTVNGILRVTGDTFVQNMTGRTGVFSSTSENVLSVIGTGSCITAPLFNVSGSQGQLFRVSDSLNGVLFSVNDSSGLPTLEVFSDDRILMGSYLAPSLNTTKRTKISSGTNTVYQIPTSAYTGAFFEYTLIGSLGARAGSIMSIWSGTTSQFTEVTTSDIGSTTDVTFAVNVSGNTANLISSATTSGWILKTIIRSI